MTSITEITRERLVYHERFDLQKNKPISTVHRFSVYKLRILKRLYSTDYGELNFLIQDDRNPAEKCVVYAILREPYAIQELKYWRTVEIDKELARYIVKGFVQKYLMGKYIF